MSGTGGAVPTTPAQPAPVAPAAPAPVPQPAPAGPAGIVTSPPPAPAPAPAQVPAVPAAPAPVGQPATGELGYPENTPLAVMTPEQQTAYWRAQARKHEAQVKAWGDYPQLQARSAQYDQLLAATQTEQQRAVAEAEARGRQAAMAENGTQLAEAWLRSAIGTRLPREQADALVAGANLQGFVAAGGQGVDTDKVFAYVNAVVPYQVPQAQQVALPPAAGGVQYPAPVGMQPPGGPLGGQWQTPQPAPAGVLAAPGFGQPPAAAGVPGYPAQPGWGAVPAVAGGVQYPAPIAWQPAQPPADFGQGQTAPVGMTGFEAGKAAYQRRHANGQGPGQANAVAGSQV